MERKVELDEYVNKVVFVTTDAVREVVNMNQAVRELQTRTWRELPDETVIDKACDEIRTTTDQLAEMLVGVFTKTQYIRDRLKAIREIEKG